MDDSFLGCRLRRERVGGLVRWLGVTDGYMEYGIFGGGMEFFAHGMDVSSRRDGRILESQFELFGASIDSFGSIKRSTVRMLSSMFAGQGERRTG